MGACLFAALLFLDVAILVGIGIPTFRRAGRAGWNPGVVRGLVIATWAVGSIAGLIGMAAALRALKEQLDLPPWAAFGAVALSNLGGAAVGPAIVYLIVRARTARHPDYEEPAAGPGHGSLEADVPEARDGDHVRPD